MSGFLLCFRVFGAALLSTDRSSGMTRTAAGFPYRCASPSLTFDLPFQLRTHRRRPAGSKRRLRSPASVCSATPSRRYVSALRPVEASVCLTRACLPHACLSVCFRGRGRPADLPGMWSGSTAPSPTRTRSRGEDRAFPPSAPELSHASLLRPQLPLHRDGGAPLLEVRGHHAGLGAFVRGAGSRSPALAGPARLGESPPPNRIHLDG